jgi:hypothetical protein
MGSSNLNVLSRSVAMAWLKSAEPAELSYFEPS